MKISEKGTNRERSTIIVPGQSLPWFRELFNYYATTEPSYALVPPSTGIVVHCSILDEPRMGIPDCCMQLAHFWHSCTEVDDEVALFGQARNCKGVSCGEQGVLLVSG